MAKYGKTYWGAQFLNALAHIDYSNRLPRGRNYASKGSVKSIEFDKNKIYAKVQGSRPRPYNISIIVPEFSQMQKNDLIEAIKSNTSILAALLNRQLPPELLEIAGRNGIEIFPKQWKDFGMDCSCPDWAVPCKHLAAVIYIIANEIDLNPFKVLELHGLDVVSELAKSGMQLENDTSEKIESLTDCFTKSPIISTKTANISGLDELDFSLISKYDDTFLNLLSPNPPFYEKDFKSELLTHFRYVSKNINRHNFCKWDTTPNYDLNSCNSASVISVYSGDNFLVELSFENAAKRISLPRFFNHFSDTENFSLLQVSDEIKLLYHFFLFAKKLIEQGAVIPQLISFDKNHLVRWVPLMQDRSAKLQLDVLNRYFSLVPIINEGDNNNISYFSDSENFALTLTSIFTTVMIRDILIQNNRVTANDFITDLFFRKAVQSIAKTKDILNSVQLWLNKIHVHKRSYIPILEIEEKYPKFNVALSIRETAKNKLTAPVSFHLFKKKNKNKVISVTMDLQQLQENFPDFRKIINSNEKQSLQYDSEKFAEFLFRIIPVLQLLGIEFLLPKSLKYIVKPAVSLKAKTTRTKDIKSYLDLISILSFEWQVSVGDELMDETEFLKLVKGMNGIVKIKDQFIHVTQQELDKLLKHLRDPAPIGKQQMLQVLFANEFNGAKIEITEELAEILQEFRTINTVPLPEGVNAQLRPYQLRGYEWLYKNSKIGFGSILADDMGLGKTLQTLAMLLKYKEDKLLNKEKAIIIMPTTLLTNWRKEIEKFTPSLTYHIYHGSKRDIAEFSEQDVLLTSYGIVRSDADVLNKRKWHVVIIDEAQNIKNHNTDQTKAVKSIHSNIKIALSGTPVENRLSEYWSIFDFSNKGYLGGIKHFNDEYAKPIAIEKSHKQLEVFKKITSPFIMRRMKTDKSIISDLPDKIQNNQYTSLTKQQAALYESTVNNAMRSIEESDGIQRKGMVLKMLTALKQIGNHPYQYLKTGPDSPELSGKISMLFELLTAIIDNNEKTLIFTQYKEMGDLLQSLIREEFKTEPLFLHGSLSRKQRETLIDDFQNKAYRKIFILSLKAGGTGLNLTQAQNVIHFDLWWNPAVETQATDRAYRIGQKSNVMVYRLINKGTMEERIDDMLKDKKELADLTVSSGEKWLGELNNKELKELVRLTVD